MNAYCMVQITVHNSEEYAKYAALAGPAVQKYGGEFLARGGKCLTKEGPVQLRNVIIKFPDFDSAITFYESQEYSAALEFALADGVSTRNYTIVEGV
ncbi:DUF1330 domain-containing protein [Amylibacter sp.]|jgi:uncharacterized protein (DUF1330 family)|nr:DUF1330 domain-containing protein [Rhodobacterales bacterium]MCO4796417.1 DUF1330 domain-containing protein [Amylibacter sp.]MBT4470428.1 DUF1330 domain-containing protein [Rhodobacterales bacterium]MBT6833366.1 DUF1330 domain-containing protein [Rhodobacterales bacterium]MBT7560315.1 DUF1330 domain-containing protein [Rhodobacterales bacterium]|tara:strand:- start:677 stop:967 length:291 start_codon:yes stop_codon:yes gene_type:complete